MLKIKLVSVFGIVLLSGLLSISHAAWAKKNVNIGVLIDAKNAQQKALLSKLREELKLLLSSKYNVQLKDKNILSSNWSASISQKNYAVLAQDKKINVILALGIISSSVVVKQKNFDKPVIAVGIVDPAHQNINLTKNNTSGIKNLSYILFNRSITKDLEEFYRVFPYKKVALIASSDLIEQLVLKSQREVMKSSVQKMMKKNNTEFVVLPVKQSISEALQQLDGIDAVYVGFMANLEGSSKDTLIQELIRRKIPSFGFSVADVERGVLFASAPKLPVLKIVRRLTLNIEAILDGQNASSLPVNIKFRDKLAINMETADKIGYSPKFSLLATADLINRFSDSNQTVFTLKQAIQEALVSNLSLKIETDRIKTTELDVKFAQANRYPSLSLNATGTQIDEDRAAGSFGKQAEKSTSASLKLEQLIYSETVSGNIEIQNYLLDSTRQAYQIQKLDIIEATANSYFDLLSAKTNRNIQQENVSITRKNLTIAKQREAAGYSGRSDVYYWESQLAGAETDYLAAVNQFKLVQIQLNQFLNRPLDKKFVPENISLSKGEYANYLNGIVKKYVNTPVALEKFTGFLVLEALKNAPEISQINANLNAQKRRYSSARKKRFIPTVSFVAESQRIYSRSGAGSDISATGQDDDTWSASVNLSWPLYQGGSISIEGQQAQTQIKQLRDQRLQLRQSLELSVRANMLDLVTQSVNLKSSQRSATFSKKSLNLVQDAYSKGKSSVVELSDAQRTSIIADQRALNSIYVYFSAVLKLERAVGQFSILSSAPQQANYIQRLETYFNAGTSTGVK